MTDKQVELIISNQEHQIALLMELLQSQPAQLTSVEKAVAKQYYKGT